MGDDIIKNRGMATIEASLVIPLFMFVVMAFLQTGFLVITNAHIYVAFSQAVEETAEAAYSSEVLLGAQGRDATVSAQVYLKIQKKLKDDTLVSQFVSGGVSGIFLTDCTLTEEAFIEATLRYQMKLRVPLFTLPGIWFTEQQKQKAYLGYVPETETEAYVYVTDYQSVYHLERSCTHLTLCIYEVAEEQLKKEYEYLSACSYCKNTGTRYYVTSQGDCYHQSLLCPGLKRTIYRVKKSSVADKAPCSRCGGG